jgi:hypothetical protein
MRESSSSAAREDEMPSPVAGAGSRSKKLTICRINLCAFEFREKRGAITIY